MRAVDQRFMHRPWRFSAILVILIVFVDTQMAVAQYATEVSFSGRNWGVKESTGPVGPGGNRFSARPSDVWVDSEGLHLTINQHEDFWYSTEVVMSESLGYGTYTFQTTSRMDILNANATFGAFTWDPFGDDTRIPDFPNRELDFEDSRWGDPTRATNSQFVVQPYYVLGNLRRFTLPDLSADSRLTRILKWNKGRVEFLALHGHYTPYDYPETAVIDRYVLVEDVAQNHIVPTPGRENFRFNLWLNQDAPIDDESVEVTINHFAYFHSGDFDGNGRWELADIDALVAEISEGTNDPRFDQTGDGRVDQADLAVWLAEAGSVNLPSGGSYLRGDANLDGSVDVSDFNIWNSHKFEVGPRWSYGDFNADGVVDASDFNIWNAHKFVDIGGENTVPEPSAATLLCLSLLLLGRSFRCFRVA